MTRNRPSPWPPGLRAAVVCSVLLVAAVAAQTPAPQDKAAALKESLAKNAAALKQYAWVETTDISLKGEVKKHEQKNCYYGADGKVQKTPIAGAAPPKAEPSGGGGGGRRGSGRAKEKIVENKVEELKEYMEKAAALVHEYVPPNPQKIQEAQAAGNVNVQPPAAGAPMQFAVKNYVKQGDALAIGIDAAALKLASYSVNSYVEKPKDDDVTLKVTFATLPDGTAYPQQILLDVKAKQVQVKITNSGYKKAGS